MWYRQYDIPVFLYLNGCQDKSLQDRLDKIKQAFNDVKTQENALSEIDANISKEKIAKAAKDANKFKNSPIQKFKMNLVNFIKNEVASSRGNTWGRFNKKYDGTGIIKPGRGRVENKNIPSINVYYDRSGSWDDAKTKVGSQAIATLNNYVKRGEIKINLFYFSNNVHDNQEACYHEGGTKGQPIMNHIKATKPDNVIVMTDDDIVDINDGVTVPGAVWLLFKGGESKNLIENIKGKKQTKIYDI